MSRCLFVCFFIALALIEDFSLYLVVILQRGNHAHHIAAENGNVFASNILLHFEANIEQSDSVRDKKLQCVCDLYDCVCVCTCLYQKNNRRTPLHYAVLNGHECTVSLLVTLQANIETKDKVSDNYDVCVSVCVLCFSFFVCL